jgi:hypothetical protein
MENQESENEMSVGFLHISSTTAQHTLLQANNEKSKTPSPQPTVFPVFPRLLKKQKTQKQMF